MAARLINGPQDRHERTGGALFRDTRTFGQIVTEFLSGPVSGFAVIGTAAACVFWPATVDVLAPLGAAFGGWAISRPKKLPIRLPLETGCKDPTDINPLTRRPYVARGSYPIGWDESTGREIWLSGEDMRLHFVVPGATGAGKTQFILALLSNALAQGSGFVLIDGKAANDVYGSVYALARTFGLEDQVKVINLLQSGDKRTNTFNPFATCSATALVELLTSQIEPGHGGGGDNSKVFTDRARALLATLAPIIVWLREHRSVPTNIDMIRSITELQNIVALAKHRIYRFVDETSGEAIEMAVAEMPEEYLIPLRAYLGESGGFDLSLEYNTQRSDEPSKQHSFVVMNFSQTFSMLAVELGHIFRCQTPDVVMRDVLFNRRILVVNLPSLEGSEGKNMNLGRLVVAAVRGAMAETIGASLEGAWDEIVANRPSKAATPYPIVMDEAGYYITSATDVILAQARSLGFSIGLGFQEVGSFYKRLGEHGATPVLGNPKLKVILRLEDATYTRTWIEKAAGDTDVTQVGALDRGESGLYSDQQQAVVRRVSRVDWQDVVRLEPNQAIILYGGRRIYARLWWALPDVEGSHMRVHSGLALPPPATPAEDPTEGIRKKLLAGLDQVATDEDAELSPVLQAAFEAYGRAMEAGLPPEAEIDAVLNAVEVLATGGIEDATPEQPLATYHPFGPLFAAARQLPPLPPFPVAPVHERDHELVQLISALESQLGVSASDARLSAMLLHDELAAASATT